MRAKYLIISLALLTLTSFSSFGQMAATRITVQDTILTSVIEPWEELTVKATDYVVLKNGFHAKEGSSVTIKCSPMMPLETYDMDKNWNQTIVYDENGSLIGQSIGYFDYTGKATQSLSRNFEADKLLVSQPIYDAFGRSVVSHLPFLTDHDGSISYQDKLITPADNSDKNYDYKDIGKAISLNCALGKYYSTSGFEKNIATSPYPFSQNYYSQTKPGVLTRSAAAGDKLQMDSGHEVQSFVIPASDIELSVFKNIDNNFPLEYKGLIKNISIAADGKTAITYITSDERIVASCLVGGSHEREIYANTSEDFGFVDLHFSTTKKVSLINYQNYSKQFDYSTRSADPDDEPDEGYIKATVNNNKLTIKIQGGCNWSRVKVNELLATQPTLPDMVVGEVNNHQLFIENGRLKLTSKAGGGSISREQIFSLDLVSKNSIQCTNLSNDEELNITVSSTGYTQPAGVYRIYNANLAYRLNYYNYSLNFYDKAGRLRRSLSPKATQKIIDNGYSKSGLDIDAISSTFEYNGRGELTQSKSPDEGTTRFKYRKDRSLRFSQNSEQAKNNAFSYTNYDKYGRIIQTGEYQGSLSFDDINSSHLEEIVSGDGNSQHISVSDCHDKTITYYTTNFSDEIKEGYQQHYIRGQISKTTNGETGEKAVSTWYSYTYDGKIEWTIQSIGDDNSKIFTIDYKYNARGLVDAVIYQKGISDEEFTHFYEYDLNGSLKRAYTKAESGSKQLQATYYYYAHGPVKRIELANNLQGIDYVYTLNGMLKSINHPDLTADSDPGKDSDDAFGMTLDYFRGDYINANNKITTSSSIVDQKLEQFNGNIAGIRWNNKEQPAPNGKQFQQTFTYNQFNYLGSAKWGQSTGNRNHGTQHNLVNGLTYDPNGNIQTLKRYTTTGVPIDNFTYTYNVYNNQLTKLIENQNSDLNHDLKQGTYTYAYDEIGRITKNDQHKFTYNAYQKVEEVTGNDGTTIAKYLYDTHGYRYRKDDLKNGVTTYYVRDISGNIISIYKEDENGLLNQTAIPIYAASRIGLYTKNKTANTLTPTYELRDHLGNVRTTIKPANPYKVEEYADYYPFGMKIDGYHSISEGYRFGYQGEFAEQDDETGYNQFELRLWDSRIARWLSPDPYKQYNSSYLGMGNRPNSVIDPDGGEGYDWYQRGNTVVHIDGFSGSLESYGFKRIQSSDMPLRYIGCLPKAEKFFKNTNGFRYWYAGSRFNQLKGSMTSSMNQAGRVVWSIAQILAPMPKVGLATKFLGRYGKTIAQTALNFGVDLTGEFLGTGMSKGWNMEAMLMNTDVGDVAMGTLGGRYGIIGHGAATLAESFIDINGANLTKAIVQNDLTAVVVTQGDVIMSNLMYKSLGKTATNYKVGGKTMGEYGRSGFTTAYSLNVFLGSFNNATNDTLTR